jgi:putative RNA 2'-phosphotransferase
VERFLAAIMAQGLQPMGRHHVHLSSRIDTARLVGARRGKPVILKVLAGDLARTGVTFWRPPNEVWLVEAVPPRFLEVLQASA